MILNNNQVFLPGQEWLYYKIYCGPFASDIFLSETIKPMMDELEASNFIDKWFFLRYSDPDSHIRFRIHAKKQQEISVLFSNITTRLVNQSSINLIWKLQIDTYFREFWRYGQDTISFFEEIFHNDSIMVVDFISKNLNIDEYQKLIFSMNSVDKMLNDFGFSIFEKHEFMDKLKNQYMGLFGQSVGGIFEIDKLFRQERKNIENVLENEELFANFNYLTKKRSSINVLVINNLNASVSTKTKFDREKLISDVVHMAVNRIFFENQNKYETVVYYLLNSYYKSKIARFKKSVQ